MLEAISVCNYRTFPKRTEFELAPLTVLLGVNSSGKSSVTRLLPLFAQSLTRRSAGPLLWVSDNLDYGSFRDNVHNNDVTKSIVFTLRGHGANIVPIYYRQRQSAASSHRDGEFSYSISIGEHGHETRINSVEIEIYGERVRLNSSGARSTFDTIIHNGRDVSHLIRGKHGLVDRGFIPEVFFFRYQDGEPRVTAPDEFIEQAASVLGRYAHANTTNTKLRSLLTSLPLLGVDGLLRVIENRAVQIASLRRNFHRISEAERREIWLLLFLASYDSVANAIRLAVESDITAGGYLGPVRARASRYYRRQELSVDQIDSTGDNLAMYLGSLDQYELGQINDDLSSFFGHEIKVHPGEGHISLRIGTKGEEHTDNLADVGFGFTQLLPVIAQVHAARRPSSRPLTSSRTESPIFAVEQPELHLHPAYQAKLGSYLVHAATQPASGSRSTNLRFLIETHSEPLVNAIASAVATGQISANQVRIYLFERAPGAEGTEIVEADIQANGEIPNWPFGFFTSGRLHAPAFI